MKNKLVALIGVIFILLILISVKLIASSSKYSINRHISYSLTIQNTTNRVVTKPELLVYAPVKKTATQICGKISSSHPYDLIEDDLGNQVLKFTFPELAPYENRVVTVEADVNFSNNSNKISVKNKKNYLKPEKYIESDNPIIIKTAKELKASNKLSSADKAFQWVTQNIKYSGYIQNERGALYAFNYKEGDCTEFSDLFVALCRANDVPARTVSGYIIGGSTILDPGGFHNWAEFFNGVWNIVDAQNKIFMKDNSKYLAIRIISRNSKTQTPEFNRFHIKGDGLKVSMN